MKMIKRPLSLLLSLLLIISVLTIIPLTSASAADGDTISDVTISKWIKGTNVTRDGNSGLYQFDDTDLYGKVHIVRIRKNADPSWDNKVNQTMENGNPDVGYPRPSGTDTFALQGWGGNNNAFMTGTWYNYGNVSDDELFVDAADKNGAQFAHSDVDWYICTWDTFTLTEHAAVDAGCTTPGNIKYYTAGDRYFVEDNGSYRQITQQDTIISAAGHDWDTENIDWQWYGLEDVSVTPSAKATIHCKNCTETEERSAEISGGQTKEVTCTQDGEYEYTASIDFNDVTYTDVQTVTIPADGHDWDFDDPACDWIVPDPIDPSDPLIGVTCDVTLSCRHYGCTDQTEPISASVSVDHFDQPTCENTGSIRYIAEINYENTAKMYYSDYYTVPVIEHDWNYSQGFWTWDPSTGSVGAEHPTATYTFGCSHCSASQTISADMVMLTDSQAASCTQDGYQTFTATVSFDGIQNYSDDKTYTIPATGHVNMEYFPASPASCTSDGSIEYWYCSDCQKYFSDSTGMVEITQAQTVDPAKGHINMQHIAASPATCDAEGNIEYWYCPDCQKYFSDAECQNEITQEQTVISKTAHSWSLSKWKWEGFTSASAVFACENCSSETSVDATVTSAITTPSTEDTPGVRTYTATVTFGGVTYTDTKEETIPAGVKNGLSFDADGEIRYYINGVPQYQGLVTDGTDYYYINSTKKAVKSCTYGIGEEKANGLKPAGKYTFDAEGKMVHPKNGLTFDADGEIRYYVNDVPQYQGLVQDNEGNYYYINSSKKAVKDCTYSIGATKTNGLKPAGKYSFDADGKMIIVPDGLTFDADGEIRYYVNGVPQYQGLVTDGADYYYINSTKKAVKNCTYSIGATKTNSLKPAGKYSFDADGKMIIVPDGVTFDADGEIRYYEDGVPVYKGLVEYQGHHYYFNSTKKAVRNATYRIYQPMSNGLLPQAFTNYDETVGEYYIDVIFGDDGQMAFASNDPPVEIIIP